MHCLSIHHSATLCRHGPGNDTFREENQGTRRDKGVVDIFVVFACLEVGQRGAALGRVWHHLHAIDAQSPQQASALAFSVLIAIFERRFT